MCGPGEAPKLAEMGHFDSRRADAVLPVGRGAVRQPHQRQRHGPRGRSGATGPPAVRRPPGRRRPHRARRRGRRLRAVLHRRHLLGRSRRAVPEVPVRAASGSATSSSPGRGRWLRATIDRPEARNAISPSVIEGLEAAVRRARRDGPEVLVLRGAGGTFCAGADLDWVRSPSTSPAPWTDGGAFTAVIRRLNRRPRRHRGGTVRLGGRRRGLRPGRRLRAPAGLRRRRGRRGGPDRRPPPRARAPPRRPADRCGSTRRSPPPAAGGCSCRAR